jgi:hypothetical protein
MRPSGWTGAGAAVRLLAATFVTGALLAATSYSVWAPWLMASLAMVCVFAGLGTALPTALETLDECVPPPT